MPSPRRHIIRPSRSIAPSDAQRRIQKLRSRLDQERAALARWMARLKRAFHALEKHQLRAHRLERQIARLED
jgi:hypothetical protein